MSRPHADAPAGSVSETPASQPNILFVFSDQQHWQACGFADPFFHTPALDRLARESTTFTHAFCSTPQCSPSRSSLLTGLYPSKTGVLGNLGTSGGSALAVPTVAAPLKEAGYRTAYIGKWHLGDDPAAREGWDAIWDESSGFTDELGFALGFDREVTRRAADFIGASDSSDAPWALFVSYNDPHAVYGFSRYPDPPHQVDLPPSWHMEDLARKPLPQRLFMEQDYGQELATDDRAAWEKYRYCYRDRVRLFDLELGKLLHALDEAAMSGNTLVLVTSDHGDMDANHRLAFKGPFMYENLVRVPLIVRLPESNGGNKKRSCDALTVNVDLVATIADFAGLTGLETDGLSLAPLLRDEEGAARRDCVVAQYYSKQTWVTPIRMFRTDRWKLNVYTHHGSELYDLTHDPQELTNLADDPAYAEVRATLETRLEEWMRANHDPFRTQRPTNRLGVTLTAS